jgi:glycosyltransferase involved in cell wall biosynthesis
MSEAETVHLFNGFQNPFGGSELETLAVYHLLSQQVRVQMWATSSKASAALLDAYPVQRLSVLHGRVPNGGNYVFFGAHWRNRIWPYLIARPRRLIYVFNTFHPKVLQLTSERPPLLRWPRTEYVLISEFQKRLLGIDGAVHPSPIDLTRFMPHARVRAPDAPLVLGRLSRDTADKHHPDDLPLYRTLLASGWQIRLQGATILAPDLPVTPALQLLPEGQISAETFLGELDVFYYRTGVHVETFGRVVFEAMACGLPVVCHRHGGYADHIRHGENGYLFDTTDQAAAILTQLQHDPDLRARIGANARRTVEALFSPEALQARMLFLRA